MAERIRSIRLAKKLTEAEILALDDDEPIIVIGMLEDADDE